MWKVRKEGEGFVIYVSRERCPGVFPELPPGWEGQNAGGAYPYFIAYDPEKVSTIRLSAGEAGKWERGDLYLDNPEQLIEEVPASSHGCWKIECNQLILVVRKPYRLCAGVYSAYELAEDADEVLPGEVVEQALVHSFPLPVSVEEKDCVYCRRKKEKAVERAKDKEFVRECIAPYVKCPGHAVLDSLYSSTFNESGRYGYNYRLKVEDERIEKALRYPTQKIDYAFLTKEGEVYLIRGKYSFRTKDRGILSTLFEESRRLR